MLEIELALRTVVARCCSKGSVVPAFAAEQWRQPRILLTGDLGNLRRFVIVGVGAGSKGKMVYQEDRPSAKGSAAKNFNIYALCPFTMQKE